MRQVLNGPCMLQGTALLACSVGALAGTSALPAEIKTAASEKLASRRRSNARPLPLALNPAAATCADYLFYAPAAR